MSKKHKGKGRKKLFIGMAVNNKGYCFDNTEADTVAQLKSWASGFPSRSAFAVNGFFLVVMNNYTKEITEHFEFKKGAGFVNADEQGENPEVMQGNI
jgi:hypothetical protein